MEQMAVYRLLHFRGSKLERWEEFEAPAFSEALDAASNRLSADGNCAELWRGDRRLATFKQRKARR